MQNQDHKTRAGLYLKRDVCGLKEHAQCAICNTQSCPRAERRDDVRNTQSCPRAERRDATRYTTYAKKALTLLEMVVAMAIIAIIFAAILPQFRAISNSWDSRAAAAEILQNGRILIEHLNRNLSKAVRITSVSGSAVASGYIEFEDNDGDTFRYDVAANNYVEYGEVGDLSDLAGPVSQFQLTCYDACDLDTAITDVNSIRFINVQFTLPNTAALGQDRTFTTSVYLRTNWNSSAPSGLIGWWKLDDGSGTTAVDSSGYENDGTLENMSQESDWVTGQIGGALDFDGNNDYVDCGSGETLDITGDITIALWVFVRSCSDPDLVTKGAYNQAYSFYPWADWKMIFALNDNRLKATSALSASTWHHIAATRDGNTRKIYIGGQEDVSDTYSEAITTTGLPLTITSVDWPFDGLIDDVRLYNRALSPEEIAQLADVLIFRQFTEAKAGSDTTSVTVSTPSGTSEGDLLITAVATDGDASSSLAPPGGEGWTEINVGDYSSDVTLGAWWKLADASESPTHQFTWSGDQQAYGWMMRFTGHEPTGPINDWAADGESSSTPTSPAVTSTVDGCLILRLGAFDDGDITVDSLGLSGHAAITMDTSQSLYEEFTEEKVSSDDTKITIDTPAGTSEDDLLIVAVVTEEDTSGSLAPPGGENWTEIDLDVKGDDVTLGVWWKLAEASESSSHEFTWSGGKQAYGWIMRFTDHDTSSPINATANGEGKSETPESPAVTTTVADTLIVRIGGFKGKDITVDAPGLSGHTAITMDKSDKCSGGAGYVTQAATGSSGTSNFSLTKSKEYRAVTIAIAPAPAAAGEVSGGAGYMKQSAAGDSGASAFSLTASEQSRTITIAIAPQPGSVEGGGGGQMLP